MASGSSSSSAHRGHGGGGRGDDGRPRCPFYKTKTVVERVSTTEANPYRKFYTCTNRDWDSRDCKFFLWKPACKEDDLEAGVEGLKLGMKEMSESVATLSTAMAALGDQMRVVVDVGNRNAVLVSRMLRVGLGILVLNLVILKLMRLN